MRKRHIRQAGREREELELELIEELDALSAMLRELDIDVKEGPDELDAVTLEGTEASQALDAGAEQLFDAAEAETQRRFEALVEQMVDMAVERELSRLRSELRAVIFKQVMGRLRRGGRG